MDIEKNQTMLSPLICEACIMRRRKKTTRRIVKYCLFIAYNVFILLLVTITLWCMNDRLGRAEKSIADLQKDKNYRDTDEKPFNQLTEVDSWLTKETEAVENAQLLQENRTHIHEDSFNKGVEKHIRNKRAKPKRRNGGKGRGKKGRKTDLAKSRKSRTVSTYTPHFYLTGSERRNSPTDERGIFMWKRPSNRSFSRGNDDFYADINSADNSLKKVTIVRPGVYFVFAKVTANGRKDFETSMVPPVGIYLMKNGAETLDVAWNTQDERGDIYTTNWGYDSDELKYPMDSLSVFGLHMLQVNDQIYIQKPPDRTNNVIDRFLNDGTKASFGAFLVESECSNC